MIRGSISGARLSSSWQHHPETQQQDHLSTTTTTSSYIYSDTSSIARFPNFQFSLGTLSVLASAQGKTCLLLAVLEVDGPDEVTVRRGPDAGRVVSLLRLIVGDEAGTIRKLTAWREVAETWGGAMQDAVGIRCGDVVYFESALPSSCVCWRMCIGDPFDIDRRPDHANGSQGYQRRGSNISIDYAWHHSVAESPLARRNLLSDDAAHVRASRYAIAARSTPGCERRFRASCRVRCVVV
jgi:hypothetical protein